MPGISGWDDSKLWWLNCGPLCLVSPLGLSRLPSMQEAGGAPVGYTGISWNWAGAGIIPGLLLPLIFCPTFISYCAFPLGVRSSFVRQKQGFLLWRYSLDSLCVYSSGQPGSAIKWLPQILAVLAWLDSGVGILKSFRTWAGVSGSSCPLPCILTLGFAFWHLYQRALSEERNSYIAASHFNVYCLSSCLP